jgi:hypothetical protein
MAPNRQTVMALLPWKSCAAKPNSATSPRMDNKHISRLLEQGAGLACRVVGANPFESTWRVVRVEVLLA